MSARFLSAVVVATEILEIYRSKYGAAPFPEIKGKLLPLIEARANARGVDNIYVKRFKEKMLPIGGQMRRFKESNGVYLPVEHHGVIYLCPTLDLEWTRAIMVKEAAHLILDDPSDYVHTATDLDRLMVCFAQFGSEQVTKHYVSEERAVVFAIEVLFPRAARLALAERYAAGKISASTISRSARIPEDWVRLAMGEEYIELI